MVPCPAQPQQASKLPSKGPVESPTAGAAAAAAAGHGPDEQPGLQWPSRQGSRAGGRLLLHGVEDSSQVWASVMSAPGGLAWGQWLAMPAAEARGQPAFKASSAADGSSSSSGGGGGGGGSLASLVDALNNASRLLGDPAFQDVPVPTVFLGGLPAPIPAGRPTLDAKVLLQQLQHGVLPSDGLPEEDRTVWRAASNITDAISAFNIAQAGVLAGRKLLLTERGLAEQLARGTLQMVPASGGTPGGSGGGGASRWNPLAPLLRLAGQVAEGRQLLHRVQERAAALSGGQRSSMGSKGDDGSAGAAASASSLQGEAAEGVAQGAAAAPAEGQQQPDLQYSLQEMPARGLLAGGTPPQLAWVPLRVALQLLRSLPQHFVVLQGSAVQLPKQQRRQGAQQAAEGREGDKGRQLEGSGQVFTAVTSPGGLEVHIIPGLHVRQVTPDGGSVEFTPAFLSGAQAQALWKEMREISGGAMLLYRRLERQMVKRRLETAAAVIATGGLAGRAPPTASAQEEDEEEGGMEEPPEIRDFIRELGGSLEQEAASAGAGGGLPVPRGLPRLAATFACGVVSCVAGAMNAVGDTVDWLMMATPLGPRLLGVPESAIERCRLGELVTGMQQYNRQQAVLGAALGPPPPLSAQAQAAAQLPALPAPPGSEGAAAGQAAAAGSGGDDAAAPTADEPSGQTDASDAAGAAAGAHKPSPEEQQEARQRHAASALHYSRTLAAAGLWLALSAKNFAEDPGVAGTSLGRLLARSFAAQGGQPTVVGGGRVQQQATPSLFGLPAPAPPSPEQHEAVEEALAAGLPLLEHNGFRVLWQPEGGDLPGPSAAGAAAAASSSSSSSSGEAARRQLAREVAKCCTGDTRLGLGAFVRDSASGGFALMANPMGPLPTGRGVVLVGDLNTAAPRRHGRSAARTTARFLTAAVEDGAKLL